MAVLDDNLKPVPAGSDEIGRLAMRGHIPLGYYNDPEKTARTFLTDKSGVRWVLPGDYARVEADGSFTLAGRGSQCINSGGEKIFVEEVERAVLTHPDVMYCAVVGVSDPVWQQRVVAVIECKPGSTLTLEALQQHCRTFIAGYKIPRALVLTPFKLTENGKIDYRWAQQQAATEGAVSGADCAKQ
jgi:acyl-CoA synthetase (AMP-forming)/AMP-acid ligase II